MSAGIYGGMAAHTAAYHTTGSGPKPHQHNCIPVRHWFRRRWLCVRCGHKFRTDMTGHAE
jgi:hypothetical protein